MREKTSDLNIYLFCPLSIPLVRGHVTQTWLQHQLFVQGQGAQEGGEGIIQGVLRDAEWSWGVCGDFTRPVDLRNAYEWWSCRVREELRKKIYFSSLLLPLPFSVSCKWEMFLYLCLRVVGLYDMGIRGFKPLYLMLICLISKSIWIILYLQKWIDL